MYGIRISLLPGDVPRYANPKNRKTDASMDIGLFISANPLCFIIFPNSFTVKAHIKANNTEKVIGPPNMHPTNTATKIAPVNALVIKLPFMALGILLFP